MVTPGLPRGTGFWPIPKRQWLQLAFLFSIGNHVLTSIFRGHATCCLSKGWNPCWWIVVRDSPVVLWSYLHWPIELETHNKFDLETAARLHVTVLARCLSCVTVLFDVWSLWLLIFLEEIQQWTTIKSWIKHVYAQHILILQQKTCSIIFLYQLLTYH